MNESAFCEACPSCQSRNWISQGDMNDCTGVDTEAIRCWKCKHEWLVEGADEFTTLEDAMIDDGREALR